MKDVLSFLERWKSLIFLQLGIDWLAIQWYVYMTRSLQKLLWHVVFTMFFFWPSMFAIIYHQDKEACFILLLNFWCTKLALFYPSWHWIVLSTLSASTLVLEKQEIVSAVLQWKWLLGCFIQLIKCGAESRICLH